eukprot:5406107-Pleurochrysis_carterae.AAC.1
MRIEGKSEKVCMWERESKRGSARGVRSGACRERAGGSVCVRQVRTGEGERGGLAVRREYL